MSEVQDKVARSVILNPQRIGLAESMRQDWVVNANEGTEVSDVLEPAYWSHVAAQMQPYDRVDVRLETGEWLLELIVMSVGRNWAQMHLCAKHDLQPITDTLPGAIKHKVEWKGPQRKFAVIRTADSACIHDGFASRDEANAYLSNHERVTTNA